MKNREKYTEEIKKNKISHFCSNFIKPYILKSNNCDGMLCGKCRMLQMLWLEEEYEEPEVDWTKVAVDTPILVRNTEDSIWVGRHFAKFEDGKVYAWQDGTTSWSVVSNIFITKWEYAKLAEREESDE